MDLSLTCSGSRISTSWSTRFKLVGFSGLLLITAGMDAHAAQSKGTVPLVFDHVTVVDVAQGKLVPAQRVVVAGARIQAVGPVAQVTVPARAQVVDASGKYLIPGLWDMHLHVGNPDDDDLARQSVLYHVTYPLLITYGVTGIREMAQRFPHGADSFRVWQRAVTAGTLLGPRTLGPSADLNTYVQTGGRLTTLADARRVIDSLQAAGDAFVKYHGPAEGFDDPQVYFALVREARRVGLPFVGHPPSGIASVIEAADSGQRSFEHVLPSPCFSDWHGGGLSLDPQNPGPVQLDTVRCAAWTSALARSGAWIVPTLAMFAYVRHLGINPMGFLMKGAPPLSMAEARHRWPGDIATKMSIPVVRAVSRLQHAGVPLLAGTDASPALTPLPGFMLQQELALLVEAAGLTPVEALQTATLNPAKFLAATDSLGMIAAGKLADLVLLNANPLANIRNVAAIDAVVTNGRYFDRATLDSVRARSEHAWPGH